MNKAELINTIREKTGLPGTSIASVINALGDAVADALKSGDDQVILSNIGKIVVRDRAARLARNPHTGQKIEVPARRGVAFKVSKNLKDAVDNPAGLPR